VPPGQFRKLDALAVLTGPVVTSTPSSQIRARHIHPRHWPPLGLAPDFRPLALMGRDRESWRARLRQYQSARRRPVSERDGWWSLDDPAEYNEMCRWHPRR